MKKLKYVLLSVLFILPFFCFAGCQASEQNLNNYEIVITYDNQTQTAQAGMVVDYVNNSSNVLNFVMFHLYPNAFSESNDGMVCSTANEVKTYPNGKSFGGVEVLSVKVDGEEKDVQIVDEEQMLLQVDLNEELFPDERVKIQIDFALTLPNANHRFGYGDGAVNFGNFYPIACVYDDEKGFSTDSYSSNGDPFFSDCANYNVTVSYPDDYTIACSGDKVVTKNNGDLTSTTIVSNNIRDFAFVLSNQFSVLSKTTNGVEVKYFYYNNQNAEKALNTACKAIEKFSDMFGDYPYNSFTIVETNFVHGGMEYPRLIMISDFLKSEDYDYVIVHETAHQWWYGLVGNDEFNEAWLDESLTEYSTVLFFEACPEYNLSYSQIVSGANNTYQFFLQIYKKINGSVGTSMLRSLDEFDTEPEYVNNIYARGVLMFDALRSQVGEKKFLSALSTYFEKFKNKIATTADFISVFEDKCGRQMEGFFNSWLEGEVVFIEK